MACDGYGGLISLLVLVAMSNDNFLLWFSTMIEPTMESVVSFVHNVLILGWLIYNACGYEDISTNFTDYRVGFLPPPWPAYYKFSNMQMKPHTHSVVSFYSARTPYRKATTLYQKYSHLNIDFFVEKVALRL